MAAQFTLTKGFSARGLRLWISQAISSLPVPLSPLTSTVAWLGAARAIDSRTALSAAESPTSSKRASAWCLRRRFSSRRRLRSMALRSAVSTRSDSRGFSRKS